MALTLHKPSVEVLNALKAEAMNNGEVKPAEWRKKMTEGIYSILSVRPLQYRSYGPYWWLVKKELIAQDIILFGETVDAEWFENMDYGDPVLNLLAAWAYADWSVDNGLIFSNQHTVTQIVNDEEVENIEYILMDDEVEIMAAGMPR